MTESAVQPKRKLANTAGDGALSKHFRRANISTSVAEKFSKDLFTPSNREAVKAAIAASKPYNHGCIPALFNDTLLRNVRTEIMENLHFTKKETDIYKLFQTGDLRNMSGLEDTELSKLENLYELRQALYSPEFRDYVSYVTGCGALSGVKQDLSINVYHKGCQLLTHDDVIGSRRISFIVYMPDPDEKWDYPAYGGALRLYPIVKPNVPAQDWTLVVPPAWNQFAFFTVQPGISFHDVEEVFVNRERMSVQGWFHIPQKGEEGFIEGEIEETEAKSTLQMLESDEVQEYDFPKRNFDVVKTAKEMSSEDLQYLAKFLNSALLKPESIQMLAKHFCDESALEIRDFLNPEYAAVLKSLIDNVDIDQDATPKVAKDVGAMPFWKLAGPPHKKRYMYMDGREDYKRENLGEPTDFASVPSSEPAYQKLAEVALMFQSSQFLSWLCAVSSLNPVAQRVLIRRFRPSLDYTLATTNSGSSQETSNLMLEGTLGLTPTKGWENGELGGYELSMLAEDESDAAFDPAVYRGSSISANKAGKTTDDDDVVLITTQADWNIFSLLVRDPGILKFVKYVSGLAPGSRWDIASEWAIKNDE